MHSIFHGKVELCFSMFRYRLICIREKTNVLRNHVRVLEVTISIDSGEQSIENKCVVQCIHYFASCIGS